MYRVQGKQQTGNDSFDGSEGERARQDDDKHRDRGVGQQGDDVEGPGHRTKNSIDDPIY